MTDSETIAHENPSFKDNRFFNLSAELLAVVSTRDGLWKRVNPAFCKTFGWKGRDLLKRRYLDLVHSDDLERSRKAVADLKAKQSNIRLENRIRCKDGGYKRISWNIAQFPSEGLMYMAGHDATELEHDRQVLTEAKKSLSHNRELLWGVFDNIPVLILIWEPKIGRFTLNRCAENVLGWTTADANKIDFISKLFPDADYRTGKGSPMQAFESGGREFITTTRDGEGVPVDWAKIRLTDDTEIAIGVDLRERKRAEGKLGMMNETLEQRVMERTSSAEARAKQLQTLAVELIEAEEKERRRFAKLLHDDLQQILAAARLQLSAVREDMPDLTALATVENLIRESIRKARGLSHDLSPAVLHHSGLIAALKWLARHMWDHFGLQVEIEEHAARNFENSSFKVFMFRAVRELLFNVVKHADVKSARIELSGMEKDLKLTVSDRGKGFDPEIPLSCDVRAGLGLISLRERALAIGGELVMESAPGQGSRFTLTVPFACGKMEENDEVVSGGEPRIDSLSGTKISSGENDIRVLFADDHQVMRQGLIELLTGQPNIEVVGEAASGKEALELTRRLKPDVVLMDVSMPEMDGIEATRHIKEELPDVRVIGLTMFDGEQMARRMLNAGVEAFVSKTASSSELLRAIYGVGRRQDDSV